MRSHARVVSTAATLAALVLVAACTPAGGRTTQAAGGGAESAITAADPLTHRRNLPGAGAVAFDPAAQRLAWAAGNQVRVLNLRSGEQESLAAGGWVSDLGFSPDGSLWVIADKPALWRAGQQVCRAPGIEADRLLALDAQGAVVAGYEYQDGTGMLRRQVWLDARCAIAAESTQRLPASVQDADADPGEPLRRASLRPPRSLPPSPPHPPGAGQARAIAASDDGRWWVFEASGSRSLWETTPRR